MKKHLCAMFLLLVFLVSVPCISSAMTQEEGEQFIHDMFADSSDEDLKNLLAAVQYELMYRGYTFDFDETHQAASPQKEASGQKEVTVPVGMYAVGIDIPSGVYTVRSTLYSHFAVKSIFDDLLFSEAISEENVIGKIELQDGEYVEIGGSAVIFSPYQGLGF